MIGHINLGMKQTGERNAGKPHVAFDAAGAGNGFMNELVRHSQRKRGATDRLTLRIPRQSSTLPTSYASLVSQLTTLESQYTSFKNNVRNFSLKTQWQTTLTSMENVQVRNTYGETNGMTAALDQNSTTAATTAWTNSGEALSGNTTTYLAGQSAGNSNRLTQLAIVETSDTVSPDCLNAVGSYRAARAASATATANLQANQLDGTSSTNSEVQQLNLVNAAQAQQLNEQQAQGALHACIAQQMTVQNMQQRNAMAHDLNLAADVQAQRAANPTGYVNSTNTYTEYLP